MVDTHCELETTDNTTSEDVLSGICFTLELG